MDSVIDIPPGTNIPKEIGDEEPCNSTKILIFSFIWAGLAATLF